MPWSMYDLNWHVCGPRPPSKYSLPPLNWHHVWDFGTHTAFVGLGSHQYMILHPMPVILRVMPQQPGQAIAQASTVLCNLAIPNLHSTSTSSFTAQPCLRARPGRMVTLSHFFVFIYCGLMGLIWSYRILIWVLMYGICPGTTSTGDKRAILVPSGLHKQTKKKEKEEESEIIVLHLHYIV